MLTIKNCRKGADADTGMVIGSFKLVDAGMCKRPAPKSDDIVYSFHWSYNDEPSRFKCYLEREPIMGTTSMYNFEIYDSYKNSLIYATSVGTHTHLKDRIRFCTWMTNQIVKFM